MSTISLVKNPSYAIINIQIRCGDYNFYSKSLHEIPEGKTVQEFASHWCKTFYFNLDEYSEDASNPDVHYFNAGDVCTQLISAVKITKKEYVTMKRYL